MQIEYEFNWVDDGPNMTTDTPFGPVHLTKLRVGKTRHLFGTGVTWAECEFVSGSADLAKATKGASAFLLNVYEKMHTEATETIKVLDPLTTLNRSLPELKKRFAVVQGSQGTDLWEGEDYLGRFSSDERAWTYARSIINIEKVAQKAVERAFTKHG